MTIDYTQMLIDDGGFAGSSDAFATRTRQEAIANVNAIRDELAAKGRTPKQIQSNSRYQAARAELDQIVAASNIVPRGTTPVTPGATEDRTVPGPGNIPGPVINPNDVNNNGIPDNLEAAQLQIDAQARAAAELRRLTLEEAAARGKAAIDLLKETIKSYFTMSGDDRFVDELSTIIDNFARDGYDSATISVMLPQTQPYKIRFAGNEGRLKAGLSALNPRDYIEAENTYSDILKRYNLGDIATRDTYTSLIGGQVSADEFADRIVNVYDRVRNADPALRAEMDRIEALSRGNLTDADFAKALLTGDKGAVELKRKISTAEITAEARMRNDELKRQGFLPGLSVDTAEDLQKLGVTREQARAGFEQIALTQPRLTQLSEMYEQETPEALDLQKELEAEQFQGLQSQRRRRLAEQETTSFMGQSGTASGISLGRRRQGSF
jgi:hypothetical protein